MEDVSFLASDAEIAVLRNKYDPRNMSGEEYDAFLDDLADMGVISQEEKRRMGYKGLVIVSYLDENGETVIAPRIRVGKSFETACAALPAHLPSFWNGICA